MLVWSKMPKIIFPLFPLTKQKIRDIMSLANKIAYEAIFMPISTQRKSRVFEHSAFSRANFVILYENKNNSPLPKAEISGIMNSD
jgi:hypothetical protein